MTQQAETGSEPERPAGREPALPPAPAVLELAAALAEAGVSYCHWKSNEAIDRTLSAENDLDLLVARDDAARFNAVLHGLGYRVARPSASRHIPGMVDHYLLDDRSGRMVHVQAHYQLVLGDDMTKNFRLPIEDAYLASCTDDGPIPVPEPAMEMLVFLLRMTVKHGVWDAQAWRKGRLGLSERRELVHLDQRTSPQRLEELRRRHTPYVSAALLARCRAAVERDASRWVRAATGRELLRALEPFGRFPPRTDLRLRLWRRTRRHFEGTGPASRRALDSGGLFVGVIGGDGSGKSSAVATLEQTFSRHFPTQAIHLGKPPRSVLTRVVGKAVRTARTVRGRSAPDIPPWVDWDDQPFPGLGYVVTRVLVARDRARTFDDARRRAARGWVVISDRMPLPQISLMDSPRCAGMPGLERRPLVRWLVARERAYHDRIGRPDLLVVLRVSPDVAVARRYDQDAEFVRRRAEEVRDQDWSGPGVAVIDADGDRDEVHAAAHQAVWAAL